MLTRKLGRERITKIRSGSIAWLNREIRACIIVISLVTTVPHNKIPRPHPTALWDAYTPRDMASHMPVMYSSSCGVEDTPARAAGRGRGCKHMEHSGLHQLMSSSSGTDMMATWPMRTLQCVFQLRATSDQLIAGRIEATHVWAVVS